MREKLIDLLTAYFGVDPAYYGIEAAHLADHLIANGVRLEEKQSTSDESKWISVKDRLPEEGEYVLCVLKGFNYGGKIQVCKFVPADKFKDKPYFEHFRNGFPSVTHWMPLPQPPKGE